MNSILRNADKGERESKYARNLQMSYVIGPFSLVISDSSTVSGMTSSLWKTLPALASVQSRCSALPRSMMQRPHVLCWMAIKSI